MATIKEDYVSFEIAKLLKEKGFNEESYGFYIDKDNFVELDFKAVQDSWNNEYRFVAPTLQMAMKWLRNTFLLEIYPFHDAIQESNDWWYRVELHTKGCSVTEYESDVIYKTYEQACEAAIKYCLENLI